MCRAFFAALVFVSFQPAPSPMAASMLGQATTAEELAVFLELADARDGQIQTAKWVFETWQGDDETRACRYLSTTAKPERVGDPAQSCGWITTVRCLCVRRNSIGHLTPVRSERERPSRVGAAPTRCSLASSS